ncbi:MAG: hypothetical protein ACXWH5_06160 [Actinomycetota bacterium]
MFDASNDPIVAADTANARMGAAQRDLLGSIAEIDRTEAWQGDGARDVAHWVGMRYGISAWKAHRWWWPRTLVLICSFHHKLVHELGWRLTREPDGQIRWFRPDGRLYHAGPSPGAKSEKRGLLEIA